MINKQYAELFDRYTKPGDRFIEFGVFRGDTFSYLLRNVGPDGFGIGVDTFTGMGPPTDKDFDENGNCQYPEGRLSTDGIDSVVLRVRRDAGSNFIFHQILFSEHTPVAFTFTRFSIAHIDFDHYQPTIDAANWCKDRCDILIFDDYFPEKTILASAAIKDWLADNSDFKIIEVVGRKAVIKRVE